MKLSVPYITAKLYSICLRTCFMLTSADAVQICGNMRTSLYVPKTLVGVWIRYWLIDKVRFRVLSIYVGQRRQKKYQFGK